MNDLGSLYDAQNGGSDPFVDNPERDQYIQDGLQAVIDQHDERMGEVYDNEIGRKEEAFREEIENLQAQINDKDLDELKKKAETASKIAQEDKYTREFKGVNAISSTINSAAFFGMIGGLSVSITGGQNGVLYSAGMPQSWVDSFTSVGETFGEVRDAPYKKAVELMCQRKEDTPGFSNRAFVRSGVPAARISASATQYTKDGQTTYDYVVDAFINVPGQQGKTAAIKLMPNGEPLTKNPIDIGKPTQFTGTNSLTLQGVSARYNQVCIIFNEPLENYFTMGLGGPEPGEKTLCTEVEVTRV